MLSPIFSSLSKLSIRIFTSRMTSTEYNVYMNGNFDINQFILASRGIVSAPSQEQRMAAQQAVMSIPSSEILRCTAQVLDTPNVDSTALAIALNLTERSVSSCWMDTTPELRSSLLSFYYTVAVREVGTPSCARLLDVIANCLRQDWDALAPSALPTMLAAFGQTQEASVPIRIIRMLAEDVFVTGGAVAGMTTAQHDHLFTELSNRADEVVAASWRGIGMDLELTTETLSLIALFLPFCSPGKVCIAPNGFMTPFASIFSYYNPETLTENFICACLRVGAVIGRFLTERSDELAAALQPVPQGAEPGPDGGRGMGPGCVADFFVTFYDGLLNVICPTREPTQAIFSPAILGSFCEFIGTYVGGNLIFLTSPVPYSPTTPPAVLRQAFVHATLLITVATSTAADNGDVLRQTCRYWCSLGRHLSQVRRLLGRGAMVSGARTPLLPSPDQLDELVHTLRLAIDELVCASMMCIGKPEEVIVDRDPDTGAFVRERFPSSQSRTAYELVRDALSAAVVINPDYTIATIVSLVQTVCNQSTGFDVVSLERASWIAGAIKRPLLDDQREQNFVLAILQPYLAASQHCRDARIMPCIATGIMYICSQHTYFLKRFWNFHYVVMNRLIKFCHDTACPAIQEMATDTLRKIAANVGFPFTVPQCPVVNGAQDRTRQNPPFVEAMIREHTPQLAQLLTDPRLCASWYETVGLVIAQCRELNNVDGDERKRQYISWLMDAPNAIWHSLLLPPVQSIIGLAGPEIEATVSPALVTAERILLINTHVFAPVRAAAAEQFMTIWGGIVDLYTWASSLTAALVSRNDMIGSETLKLTRTVCRECLTCIGSIIGGNVPGAYLENRPGQCNEEFVAKFTQDVIPLFVESVLGTYSSAPPALRDPAVLDLLDAVMRSMKNSASAFVNDVLARVFVPTVEMLSKQEGNSSEICESFFRLSTTIAASPTFITSVTDDGFSAFVHLLIQGTLADTPSVSRNAFTSLSAITCSLTPGSRTWDANIERSAAQNLLRAIVPAAVRSAFTCLSDGMHTACVPEIIMMLSNVSSACTYLLNCELGVGEGANDYSESCALIGELAGEYFRAASPRARDELVRGVLLPAMDTDRTAWAPRTENEIAVGLRDFLVLAKINF